eukprot:GHVU01171184.1.p1 GENE.GHVU01171184.1~~GHVU01171184.1.p1  ORF type:complete len:213 (+),score=40.47 GHVU01171184.1:116-754(+)
MNDPVPEESSNRGEAEEDVTMEEDLDDGGQSSDEAPICEKKAGVVYLSRIPPYMPSAKIRHEMAKYGEVGRIWLTPENEASAAKRRKYTSKKRCYVDGWVEFHKKKIAKKVAASLNNTSIGGKKRRNKWREDLWNIRYLSKFKWTDLKAHETYRKKSKQERITANLAATKREYSTYLEQVEKNRNRLMRVKRKEQQQSRGSESNETTQNTAQ